MVTPVTTSGASRRVAKINARLPVIATRVVVKSRYRLVPDSNSVAVRIDLAKRDSTRSLSSYFDAGPVQLLAAAAAGKSAAFQLRFAGSDGDDISRVSF